ncbi:hypothetical protein GOBAR_DD35183 [Gossypium barbadense]|nr:hypothetical protein GOBAR_DD35183 [Gossypium barbadense]
MFAKIAHAGSPQRELTQRDEALSLNNGKRSSQAPPSAPSISSPTSHKNREAKCPSPISHQLTVRPLGCHQPSKHSG